MRAGGFLVSDEHSRKVLSLEVICVEYGDDKTEVIGDTSIMVTGLVVVMIIIIIYITSAAGKIALEDIDRLNEIGDCGLCQTVFVKDCMIIMKKMVTPMMVRRCVSRKMVGESCSGGVRNKCSIR